MSKAILIISIGVLGTASAQKVVPCTPGALIGYTTKELISADIEPSINSLIVYYPASFPNEAKTKLISGPLSMKCPTYSVSSTTTSMRIDGPLSKTFSLLSPNFKVGEMDSEKPASQLLLAYSGDWIYPNIREDWIMQLLSAELKNGKLTFFNDGDTYQILFNNLVIGAKVNGGPLQPVFFKKTLTQIKHDSNDRIELFVKGDAAVFDYMMIDLGKSIIQIKNGIAFPAQ